MTRVRLGLVFVLSCMALVVVLLASGCAHIDDSAYAGLLVGLESSDWTVRRDAADRLGNISPATSDIIESLEGALEDYDSRVRRSAARSLGRIGPKAASSVPLLIERLDDIDTAVIQSAAWALGQIGTRASDATPELTGLMKHADADVREAATRALGSVAPRSSARVGEALTDSDPAVRAAAARALADSQPSSAETAEKLLPLLNDEEPSVRASASAALGVLGEPAVPVLVAALNRGDPIFLQNAVDALAAIGPPAVANLVERLEDADEQLIVRRYSAFALARIDDPGTIDPLIGRLGDDLPEIRISAAEALGKIGESASAAVPRLIEVATEPAEPVIVREYALIALSRIAPRNDEVVETLSDAAGDGNPKIFAAAVAALLKAGVSVDESGPSVASLIHQLESGTLLEKRSAAAALGAKGPNGADSVPTLTRALANEKGDSILRIASATALGLIGPAAETAVPTLTAILKSDDSELKEAAVIALNRIGPQERTVPALLDAMKSGELAVRGPASASVQTFAKARMETWQPIIYQSDAPVIRNWLKQHETLYGVSGSKLELASRQREPALTADYFALLGGRAAIREGVQLQLIDTAEEWESGIRKIPISNLEPVSVKSHPFDDMLSQTDAAFGNSLADIVPHDRFYAYFASPMAVQDVLSGGSDLFWRFESLFSLKSVEYDLKARYLAELGMNEVLLSVLAALNIVDELAIVTSDLFFIDGTDMTLIIRLSNESLADYVLKILGVEEVEGGNGSHRLEFDGKTVHVSVSNEFLLISNSERELAQIVRVRDGSRRNSLGQSTEFQYMLHQLPIESTTQAYVYLSDPFIRRMVSPEVKIKQLRRARARAEMEMLSSAALLHRLDGHHTSAAKSQLVDLGYVPAFLKTRDFVLRDGVTPVSETFGEMSRMTSLSDLTVDFVSEAESRAYAKYVAEYSDYWRQFFDPVAIRLDRVGDKTYRATTLILPLPDSVLYEQLAEGLASFEKGSSLRVPQLHPKPAAMLSINLSDDSRVELSNTLASSLVEFTSVDPDVFHSVGSAVHLAIQDSSPIVALGAGDLRGVFSEEMLRLEGFKSFLPFVISLATQPSTILVELAEPDVVADFLQDAVIRHAERGNEVEFHRLEGQEVWVYSIEVMDLAQLHLRVAIVGDYLMISNLPWSENFQLVDTFETDLNGARLQLNLDSIEKQLPALHTKAFSDYRAAAVDGMGYLYPLLASGAATSVVDALELHARLFGFAPVHPVSGQWSWKANQLHSSVFGSASHPVQPKHVPGDRDFGLFPSIDTLGVNMQLEETGLRAQVEWVTATQP